MNFKIEQFKQEYLERCNALLSVISENGRWNKFEDIDVIDQSYYDMYNQEAWDIFIFSKCGLSEQQSKFRKCKLGEDCMSDSPSNFTTVIELFHLIIDMKKNFEGIMSQPELYSEDSQDNIY